MTNMSGLPDHFPPRFLSRSLAALGAACGLFPLQAPLAPAADVYPSRPVRMVVGFPPGGGTDLVARIIQPRMSAALGQQIVVDNRAGANGVIAAELTARAMPDGYTLYFGHSGTLVIAPAMQKVPFDTLTDFAPVGQAVSLQNLIIAHPTLPAKTLPELIALARAKPGQVNYATSGIGSPGHLAGALLEAMTGIRLTHIPYKGGGPAITDLLAGHVPLSIGAISTGIQHVQTGRARGIAVSGLKRSGALPDVPTVAEAGVPRYSATNWYGIVAPARTPKAIVDRLNRELVAALKAPEVAEELKTRGIDPSPGSPEEFRAFISAEHAQWGKLIRQVGIKGEF